MKKIVLVVLLALGSLIKADLGVVQNESHIHSDAEIVQEALSNSDEFVVNKELVKAFSDAMENDVNDRQQNLHNTFNDYLKRPNDALDVFVKNVIDTNFAVKSVLFLVCLGFITIAAFEKENAPLHFILHSNIGLKLTIQLILKSLAYGVLYHAGYNGLRFMLERVMPVSYTKSFNEKLLAIYNRFPRMSKYLGCCVGLFDAFATHYL